MGLFRCSTNGGGGGSLTPTTLWSNNSPSTNFPSSGTSTTQVNLSDDIDNYTYLKFKFNRSTTDTTNQAEVIYTVEEFKKFTANSSKFMGAVAFYSSTGTSNNYSRRFWYVSNTKVAISVMYQIGGTYSDNGAGIPTEIIGLK